MSVDDDWKIDQSKTYKYKIATMKSDVISHSKRKA